MKAHFLPRIYTRAALQGCALPALQGPKYLFAVSSNHLRHLLKLPLQYLVKAILLIVCMCVYSTNMFKSIFVENTNIMN